MLTLVAEAITAAGLDAGVELSDVRPTIAVMNDDKPVLLSILNELAVAEPDLEVRARVGASLRSTTPAADLLLRHIFSATSLRVGIPLIHRNYRLIEAGYVDIVFVRAFPRSNGCWPSIRRASRVDWTVGIHRSKRLHWRADVGPSRRMRIVDEIDVVYTWVDSSDPVWRRSHAEHSDTSQSELSTANNAERFLDREELKYSLRSLWLHAPFVRHVYLVTADQRPEWLNVSDERITVVSHADIFPEADMLPTFNSHAIEACLHRIPGLSEHFVYMNDDVFFGREVTGELFYTKAGQARIRMAPSQYIYSGEPNQMRSRRIGRRTTPCA